MQEQPVDEMCRAKYRKSGTECPCPLQAPFSPNLHVFTKLQVLRPNTFGELWRIHYIGMID